jgi:hypothetical protein
MNTRWNAESVARLSHEDVRQLRENALGLGAEAVVALCDTALRDGGTAVPRKPASRPARERHRLIPRRAAFQMCGVTLGAGMSSWGGVRESDGMVVLSLWADDVRSEKGGCSCLLWAPNESGSRRWSDSPGGKERLRHCRLAQERGRGEGFLVHGVREEGFLPEERASTVKGVDPQVVIGFRVVQRGAEYWAVWGSKAVADS